MKTRASKILEAVKQYTKKGNTFVLKSPMDIGNGIELLARGRDINGNPTIRAMVSGKRKSMQLSYSWTPTIDDIMSFSDKDKQRMNKFIKSMM